jgi:hypothetical protein
MIPAYRQQRNSPFLTNQQKNIHYNENVKPKKFNQGNSSYNAGNQQKPLVDLQVYDQTKKGKKPPVNPALFMPMTTQNPTIPEQFANSMYIPNKYPFPYGYAPDYKPVLKNYQINVSGPTVDHSKLSFIYEDALPTKPINESLNSISERLTLYDFIRSVLIRNNDGERLSLDPEKKDNILSYIKFLDMATFDKTYFSRNPYKNMARGLLIYRSCYPIRYDERFNTTACAKNATGLNVRIYKMSKKDVRINNFQAVDFNESNLWREIKYYTYIREHIIKKKVCPNFMMLYSYHLCENPKIDFNALDRATGRRPIYQLTGENAYANHALLAITEAPSHSLFDWASKTYNMEGTVRKMTNQGYHSKEEWNSVLFQIMASLYVLQLNGILFRNFGLRDNIYIKDLGRNSMNKYWIYRINGIEYYVPNYGYLVLLDSNYKDIDTSLPPDFNDSTGNPINKTKIHGKILKDDITDTDMKKACFDVFADNISHNSFSNTGANKNNNFSPPPGDVLTNLQNIDSATHSGGRTTDIDYYMSEFMRMFMNNRIGTHLRESEAMYVRKDDKRPYYRGQIIVYESSFETYQFVLYLGSAKSGRVGMSDVLTKNVSNGRVVVTDIIDKEVPSGNIYNYSRDEDITQNTEPGGIVFNKENLIESYTIFKN